MPGREGRHARTSNRDWGSPPSRRDELAAIVTEDLGLAAPLASPAKLPPGRKDTRSWCKGKPGRPHDLQIDDEALYTPQLACKWVIRWDNDKGRYAAGWNCLHRERCTECRKVTREGWQLTRAECPLHPGDEAQRLETEARAAELGGRRRPKPAGQ